MKISVLKGGGWLPVLMLSLGLLTAPILFQSCKAYYDQTVVENAAKLQKKVVDLMNHSKESTSKGHAKDITGIMSDLDKAVDDASAKKNNKSIADSWRILRDEQIKPFMDKWKADGKQDPQFVAEAIKQVKTSFEAIERAEKAKPKK